MKKECIICCLDDEFLPGFYGLLNSLSNSPRLANLDVVLVTSDSRIYNSQSLPPNVKVRRLITESDVENFALVKSDKIRDKEKGKLFPKDSMMKWFAYDDYGYEAALLIDTDILNISDAGEIFDYLDGADVAGASLFPPELKTDSVALEEFQETPSELVEFMNESWNRGRLNSGVLCFNKRLMSSVVRQELIGIAQDESFVNEQIVLRHWFKQNRDVSVRKISPVYNFNSYYLNELKGESGDKIRDSVKFLHFVGRNKPWRNEGVARMPFVSELWERYRS